MSQGEGLLLTPGPTRVPARIRERVASPMVHHRTREFRALWERVNANLRSVFFTKNPVLTFASSGTGALDASIANCFSRGETVLAFSAGKWGERYRDIARAYGLNVVSFDYEYGKSVRPEDVRAGLDAHPQARAVLLCLCETSTGALNPVREIAAAAKRSDALILVDGISGVGCAPFRMDEWGADVAVCASQKGFMLPPGLGFVALSDRAIRRSADSDLPKYYFDFLKALEAHKRHDSAFTPAIGLVAGLDEALSLLLAEGMENVWRRHAKAAQTVRDRFEALGFEFLAETLSNGMTSVRTGPDLRSDDLLALMKERSGVTMANGQGLLKGRVVRFAHMGDTARDECAAAGLSAFEDAWDALKDRVAQTAAT